ncbi:outer membrane protein assembly factor BamB family protein [Novipirellula artificiosorum]|uniref:Outer membrane protein assembly factor BamB n=1 Tax=Novipirellula artificiosorum TaxID=2528016 RepID=A0A5C6DK09_9BACT|nr:PQQ-binding-like beta-propeller repeat protein [Novipirellula artificiosorum]TWU35931.1 Outer membrane protein assembly factor BamB precursor [Novipirellula artificiosorum]
MHLLSKPLHRFVRNTLVCLVGMAGLAPIASGETPPVNWSGFRGMETNGYVEDGTLPTAWTDQDYVWRHKLPSTDVGSMAIAAGRVFYLTADPANHSIALEAIDLDTGKVVFSRPYPHTVAKIHNRNTYASSTPTVDDRGVVVAWSDPKHTMLKSFDHDGNELWSRDLGTWQSQHGFGTSPQLFGSMVLLLNSQQGEQLDPGETAGRSRMIAVDRATGKTLWETPLKTTRTCYGVPAIYKNVDGTTQVIDANTGNGMFGLDAKTGEMIWSLPVFEMRCCSTPVLVGDLAIASAGSGGGGNHLVAVRIPATADQLPEQVYRIDRGAPYVPTASVKDGRLFLVDDRGVASCADAAEGKMIWSKRIGGNFGASPIIVGDTLLIISLDGKATLLRASERFEKLGEVDLGGPVGATPAFAQGRLLLRVGDEIRCLGGREF